jgi:hypothetical protein
MTGHDDDSNDADVAAALRTALEQRDSVVRPPRFSKMWPNRSDAHTTALAWRPLAASAAGVIVVAAFAWTLRTDRPAHIDASLAHRLSSAEYWRVPTDEVLAYEAAPLRADLPAPTGLEISLEESLL